MEDIREKIEKIISTRSIKQDMSKEIIEKIIKPIAKDAFEAGQHSLRDIKDAPIYNYDEWIRENIK